MLPAGFSSAFELALCPRQPNPALRGRRVCVLLETGGSEWAFLLLVVSEGQELPVDMETINLDRNAEVMQPAQPSLGGHGDSTLTVRVSFTSVPD